MIHFEPYTIAVPILSIFAGFKITPKVANIVAETTGTQLPDWANLLVGPLGALACLWVGARWLAGKLSDSERRADEREAKRDATIVQIQEKRLEEQKIHADKISEITVAHMRISDKVANALDSVVEEMKKRPCGIGIKTPEKE